MARLACLLTLVCLLVPATAALAQSNPFTPLPQATTTPAPTPAPTATSSSGSLGDTGSRTLFVIGAALLITFIGIGVWIARDARRALPQFEHHRGSRMMAEPAPGEPRERRRDPKAKQRARKRGRQQRKARKHNRPR